MPNYTEVRFLLADKSERVPEGECNDFDDGDGAPIRARGELVEVLAEASRHRWP